MISKKSGLKNISITSSHTTSAWKNSFVNFETLLLNDPIGLTNTPYWQIMEKFFDYINQDKLNVVKTPIFQGLLKRFISCSCSPMQSSLRWRNGERGSPPWGHLDSLHWGYAIFWDSGVILDPLHWAGREGRKGREWRIEPGSDNHCFHPHSFGLTVRETEKYNLAVYSERRGNKFSQ